MRKNFSWVIIPIVILFFSCQRELDVQEDEESTCRIAKGYYYYGAAGIYDSVDFFYSGDNPTRAEGELYLVNYTYAGDNIIGRRFTDKLSGEVLSSDTINYDGSDRIAKWTQRYFATSFDPDEHLLTHSFVYNGNRLSTITTISNDITYQESDTITHNFYYNGENIERMISRANNGNLVDSIFYAYDANKNYLSRTHKYFFLFEPFFYLHSHQISHLPYFYSQNNVIRYDYYVTNSYMMRYELDSLGNLKYIEMGGVPYMEYQYECE